MGDLRYKAPSLAQHDLSGLASLCCFARISKSNLRWKELSYPSFFAFSQYGAVLFVVLHKDQIVVMSSLTVFCCIYMHLLANCRFGSIGQRITSDGVAARCLVTWNTQCRPIFPVRPRHCDVEVELLQQYQVSILSGAVEKDGRPTRYFNQ